MTAIVAKAANAIIQPQGGASRKSVVVGHRRDDQHEGDQCDEVDARPTRPATS